MYTTHWICLASQNQEIHYCHQMVLVWLAWAQLGTRLLYACHTLIDQRNKISRSSDNDNLCFFMYVYSLCWVQLFVLRIPYRWKNISMNLSVCYCHLRSRQTCNSKCNIPLKYHLCLCIRVNTTIGGVSW